MFVFIKKSIEFFLRNIYLWIYHELKPVFEFWNLHDEFYQQYPDRYKFRYSILINPDYRRQQSMFRMADKFFRHVVKTIFW